MLRLPMPFYVGSADYGKAMRQRFQNIVQPRPKGPADQRQIAAGIERS